MESQSGSQPKLWRRIIFGEIRGKSNWFLIAIEDKNVSIRECGSGKKILKSELLDSQTYLADVEGYCPIKLDGGVDVKIALEQYKQELFGAYFMPIQKLALPLLNSVGKFPSETEHIENTKKLIEKIGVTDEIEPTTKFGHCGDPKTLRSLLNCSEHFDLIRKWDRSLGECGSALSLDASNLKSCSKLVDKSVVVSQNGVKWKLMARKRAANGKFYEAWLDTRTGIYWAELLEGFFQYSKLEETEQWKTICESSAAKSSIGNLKLKLSLPSEKDYLEAEKDDFGVLPTIGYGFWLKGAGSEETEAPLGSRPDGISGTLKAKKEKYAKIRCIGTPLVSGEKSGSH